MNDAENIELRSEKVRSIIGQIPKKIIQYGITVISILIIVILVGSYFFQYPEIYQTPLSVTSEPFSEQLYASQNGQIEFLIKNLQKVAFGQRIGFIINKNFNVIGKVDTTVLSANISGKVILNCEQKETIKKGELLLVVIPDSIKKIYSQIYLPYEYINKLKISSEVNIEMSGYPGMRYGIIKSEITKIYYLPINIQNQNYFKVEIILPSKLKSTYNKSIPFYPNMQGQAQITISKTSLLKKFFKSFN